jgi:hypothetical protein
MLTQLSCPQRPETETSCIPGEHRTSPHDHLETISILNHKKQTNKTQPLLSVCFLLNYQVTFTRGIPALPQGVLRTGRGEALEWVRARMSVAQIACFLGSCVTVTPEQLGLHWSCGCFLLCSKSWLWPGAQKASQATCPSPDLCTFRY